MIKPLISIILFIILSFQINPILNSVSITLSSSMTDTTESSYTISSNIVTLTDDEEYTITGSCSECGIEVKKGASPTITLSSITIDNSSTGPFVIKSGANVNLILEGSSTITDQQADEDEQAGIKFKLSSSLTISGDGTLTVYGYSKNGIKGASGSTLVINSGTFNVTCVNNGIAADGSVTINGGVFNIKTSEGDGIKSDPDYNDTASVGRVTITGGTFNINSYNDGIQAKDKLTISGGTFNIKTFGGGSSSTTFDKDLYSAKGIKVSTNETTNISMVISGGTFKLDTADDSVHSDGNITITGGTFIISSGDDGIHADQYLILGKSGDSNSNLKINITKSYEGLEGAQIYIYSGTYRVIASDDGINSAGDTTEDCDNFGGNAGPRGNNGQGSNNGQRGNNGPRNLVKKNLRSRKRTLQECSSFHLYVYGGNIYVNAEADGLDANGNINIYGGNLEVWGASRNADGDFADLDGTMTISGGTFFGGGNAGMIDPSRWTNSQQAIYGRNQISANNVVYIVSGSTTITSYTSPKNIAYLYYTSPSATSSYQFSTTAPSNSGSTTDSTNNANDSTDNADDENTDVNTNSNTDANTEDTDDSIEILPVDGHWYLKINLLYLILTILAL